MRWCRLSTTSIKLSNLIAPHFYDVHKHIKNHDYTEFAFPGGRGSCKSSDIGIEIPTLIKKNPSMHCLVLRKVSNTLKDSVYNQILWAIERLGIINEFKVKKSPLEIVYKPTGQTIYFRGLDDPLKVKSIKPPENVKRDLPVDPVPTPLYSNPRTIPLACK